LFLNQAGGAHRSGHLSYPNRYVTDGSRSNGAQASSTSARAGTHRRLQRGGVRRWGLTERKQGSLAMTQNGGGSLTPPPGTDGVSNGGRTPSERGGARLQNSDVSEGKKKRERLGCCAPVVCCSEASRGAIYRDGRERELGFRKVVWRENFPGRGGSGGDVGRVGRSSGVLRLLRARYGLLVTSAMVSSRV
jgi:hypothetical protein